MKKNLEILDFEDKKTQAGKRYTRFKTSEGWMSCFDTKSCDALKNLEGKKASVEIVDSGEFKNLKKCYGEADEQDDDAGEVEVEKPQAKSNGHATMYTSYAKDIFIAGQNQEGFTMDMAIKLVKQAKEAFE